MEISKKSWHYKVRNLFVDFPEQTESLCMYFWALVFKIALCLWVGGMVMLFSYTYFTSRFLISNTIGILFLLSCVSLPPIAIHFFRKKFGQPRIIPHIPQSNILWEYIKAKKHKICPIIEFKD